MDVAFKNFARALRALFNPDTPFLDPPLQAILENQLCGFILALWSQVVMYSYDDQGCGQQVSVLT